MIAAAIDSIHRTSGRCARGIPPGSSQRAGNWKRAAAMAWQAARCAVGCWRYAHVGACKHAARSPWATPAGDHDRSYTQLLQRSAGSPCMPSTENVQRERAPARAGWRRRMPRCYAGRNRAGSPPRRPGLVEGRAARRTNTSPTPPPGRTTDGRRASKPKSMRGAGLSSNRSAGHRRVAARDA